MLMTRSEVVGRPPKVSDDLVRSVDQQIYEGWRFAISEVSCEFPQTARTILYEVIRIRSDCHKSCARWIPKLLTGAQKTQRMALPFAYTFLWRCYEDGDE
jgi:hypothetical protein